MIKKIKIYLDTSVINYLFAEDTPEKQEITIDFFQNYLKDYDVFISNIVIDEINKTKDENKRNLLLNTISGYGIEIYDDIIQEIIELANLYVNKELIPENKFEDALHIAYATVYEFDILLSWNFKHLANIKIQDSINSLNFENGYRKMLIMTNPMEVIYEK